jgi:hypothetical protein
VENNMSLAEFKTALTDLASIS